MAEERKERPPREPEEARHLAAPTKPGGGDEGRYPEADHGSASGKPGVSGTEATDFRVKRPDEEEEGAGTGAAERDPGEEATPQDLASDPGRVGGERDDDRWT